MHRENQEKQSDAVKLFYASFGKKRRNYIIKSLDISKSTGPDQILPKFVKIAADIIDEHLTNIIIFDIRRNSFPENEKNGFHIHYMQEIEATK